MFQVKIMINTKKSNENKVNSSKYLMIRKHYPYALVLLQSSLIKKITSNYLCCLITFLLDNTSYAFSHAKNIIQKQES